MTAYQEIQAIVNDFFDGDTVKINLWWNTANPLLGGLAPAHLINSGKVEKLLKTIKNLQAGEGP